MTTVMARRDLITRARTAGLRLPGHPVQGWQPATPAEQHLLSEGRRLDQWRQALLAEIGRLRAGVPSRPQDSRLDRARVSQLTDCPLTAGQLEALTAAAHGELIEVTARRVQVSVDTIKSARQRAITTLGARTAIHAVAIAVAAGWIPTDQLGGTS
ncbi:hypothetical protein ACFU0X_28510 [Streptomyces cellulosae]|uniref:HTH luxR-type domain-containing protein n=1 Tax=Streptomyces cellulosae TaxID=1968 RepID=A0ABW6JRE7_STRCE